MNVIDVFQKCLVYACLAGAAVCFLAVLAYHFRDQLRELHERWLGLGPLGRVVSILAVTLAVLYGGTKSPTNEVTGTGATGTGATGVSPVAGCVVARSTGATGVSPVAGWVVARSTGATGVSPVAGWVVARNTGATGVSPVAGWGPNGGCPWAQFVVPTLRVTGAILIR